VIGRALLLAAAVATAPAPQAACPPVDAQAAALLAALAQPAAGSSFDGVATLQRGANRTLLRLRQTLRDGDVAEQLTLLGGSEQPILRARYAGSVPHPGQRLLRAAATPGPSAECGISAHYRIRHEAGAELLGRPTERLLVQPRDHYRHGYLLHIDAEHRVLLKVVTLDAGGRVLEQFQFAELTFGQPSGPLDAGSEAGAPVPGTPVPPHRPEMQDAPAWEAGWLPPGFIATQEVASTSGQRSFTDGFSVFSVFLERTPRPLQPGEGAVREGSTVAYTRGTRLAGEPVLITVLGEVPINTARMVADAVRPRG